MINKRTLISSAFVLLLSISSAISNELTIPADSIHKIVGVRIEDIVSSNPGLIPGLANIVEIIKKSPEAFFTQGPVDVIHDIFVSRLPEVDGGMVKLNLTAFIKYKDQSANFEKLTINYDTHAKALSDLSIQNDGAYSVKEMNFQISVGLIERKVIIEDKMKGIKLVFPIGVGAFDEAVMNERGVSLVTPRFQNGFIDQRAVISKREKPRYFDGKPFIRVLKGHDLVTDSTAIGFHIEINDSFVRGFDSHGCMRLRVQDLMAFHDLIMLGSVQQTPITITYKTSDLADHPAPKRNKTYKTILNTGTIASPFFIYDRDNLVQMVLKENSQAPVEKLVDSINDDYYDLFNYETIDQIREQDVRRKNECDAKVMSGEILSTDKKFKTKYQECIDAGKRKDTLSDRIYRKYMGIDD